MSRGRSRATHFAALVLSGAGEPSPTHCCFLIITPTDLEVDPNGGVLVAVASVTFSTCQLPLGFRSAWRWASRTPPGVGLCLHFVLQAGWQLAISRKGSGGQ